MHEITKKQQRVSDHEPLFPLLTRYGQTFIDHLSILITILLFTLK